MWSQLLYGKDKKDGLKEWFIEVVPNSLTAIIYVSHGKSGGKMTKKMEEVMEGKQGRTPYEQAISQAEGKIKKQRDKGYRDTVEELEELPLLAMLAGDYNKIGHRIKFPCYSSVKLDGLRCLAKKKDGVVTLESRTGQPYSLPHVEVELNSFMFDGEVLDGELYLHGVLLQDITSAVKRTDTQAAIDKAHKRFSKIDARENDPSLPDWEWHAEQEAAYQELQEAMKIHELRPELEFIIFDVPSHNYDFLGRLGALSEVLDTIQKTTPRLMHVKVLSYDVVLDDGHLRNTAHPQAVDSGYEGVMLRNVDGLYESGKRSADLQKFKTFLDTEFQVVGWAVDKDGGIIYECRNDLNDLTFHVVMGSMVERKQRAAIGDTFIGLWLTVKYQSRYKGTLLPQFPVGLHFREGTVHNGEFVPSN